MDAEQLPLPEYEDPLGDFDQGPAMLRRLSACDAWDAANECAHGKLPHQHCDPCGRMNPEESMFDRGYPGITRIVAHERLVG